MSQSARRSSRCIPSGPASPARSASVHPFFRSRPATSPGTYSRTRARGSTGRTGHDRSWRPLQLRHGKISRQLVIGTTGTLNEPEPAEAEREVLGRYGSTPVPPAAGVELLVKVFGCTASTANV